MDAWGYNYLVTMKDGSQFQMVVVYYWGPRPLWTQQPVIAWGA